MQLVARVTLPNSIEEMQYVINRDELLRLKSMNLIQGKLYVYFALKLSYNTANPSIDIESFCEDWQITGSELGIAIAQLQKKGALQPVATQLELELF